MPSWAHSSRSAGSCEPGGQQPELDRGTQTVDGLLEGRLGERTGAKTASGGARSPAVTARGRLVRRAHNRSNPRKRSQSVTAAPNAASSTSAG